ncbi:hypothetical protein C0212_08520 [Moraxella catarrhalis]|nr:hypothetical protein [Moraxella catarrhalis]
MRGLGPGQEGSGDDQAQLVEVVRGEAQQPGDRQASGQGAGEIEQVEAGGPGPPDGPQQRHRDRPAHALHERVGSPGHAGAVGQPVERGGDAADAAVEPSGLGHGLLLADHLMVVPAESAAHWTPATPPQMNRPPARAESRIAGRVHLPRAEPIRKITTPRKMISVLSTVWAWEIRLLIEVKKLAPSVREEWRYGVKTFTRSPFQR